MCVSFPPSLLHADENVTDVVIPPLKIINYHHLGVRGGWGLRSARSSSSKSHNLSALDLLVFFLPGLCRGGGGRNEHQQNRMRTLLCCCCCCCCCPSSWEKRSSSKLTAGREEEEEEKDSWKWGRRRRRRRRRRRGRRRRRREPATRSARCGRRRKSV